MTFFNLKGLIFIEIPNIIDNKEKNTISKKIGSMTYDVVIHFSKTSKEDINDKLIRIIKNDDNNSKNCYVD